MVHKNVGADQSNNMLLKLEEDAEVAYNEYDKAVAAEDRAEAYVIKVWNVGIYDKGVSLLITIFH